MFEPATTVWKDERKRGTAVTKGLSAEIRQACCREGALLPLRSTRSRVNHVDVRYGIQVSTTFVVAIPTFRRPHDLRRCLDEVAPMVETMGQDPTTEFVGSILVIDNDPDGMARETAQSTGAVPGRYVVEPTPGIAAVRDRALTEAEGHDLLIFIDDDEHPLEHWLTGLLQTWRDTNAAVVGGRVVSEFEIEPSAWITAGEFFVRRRLPTGAIVPTAAAGNMLIDLHEVRRLGVRFDSSLGLRGGEDTLFTMSVTQAGGTVVWCNDSEVVDRVPAERCTARWVLTRAFHHGSNDTVVRLRLTRSRMGAARLRFVALCRGAARIAFGLGRAAFGLVVRSSRHQARGLRAVCRGAGMASAACGVRREEYARR